MTLKNKPAATLTTMVLLMTITLASGCTNEKYNPALYAKNGTYYNPNLGIKFDYPADWNVIYINPRSIVLLDIKSKDSRILSFAASEKLQYPANMTLKEFHSLLIKEVETGSMVLKLEKTINVKNINWSIIYFFDTKIKNDNLVQVAETFCSDYIFGISYHNPNNNQTFDFTPIMESLECGEVKNP